MRESKQGEQVVHIRKEGQSSMNRDEGSYTPSHMYDKDFLPRHITTVARTGRTITFIFFSRRPLIETETSR